jgi:hypothetical protein
MNSMVCVPAQTALPLLGRFGQFADGFCQFFFRSLFDLLDRGVFDQALQESNALDQLRPALQQQQPEAQRHHGVHRPADQAPGVGRHFARAVARGKTECRTRGWPGTWA